MDAFNLSHITLKKKARHGSQPKDEETRLMVNESRHEKQCH
jgi:hypothetical protein